MATVTLRPDGVHYSTYAQGPTPWFAVGTGSLITALSDNSDSTFAASTTASFHGLNIGFGALTLPSLAQIRYVRPRVRLANTIGTTGDTVGFAVFATTGVGPATEVQATTSLVTYTGGSLATSPDGTAWTKALVDEAGVTAWRARPQYASGATHVYEMYLDVTYNEAPVVTVSLPSESGTINTSQPLVEWTYTDADGDRQERYRVKIFSSTKYSDGAFNPDTWTADWDSGEVFSSNTQLNASGVYLANGVSYRAYVKISDVGSGGRYSNWDYNQFTVSLTAPSAPTFTVTPDSSQSRIRLVSTAAGGLTTPSVTIQRSVDEGNTWQYVRSAYLVPVSASAPTLTVYDYEMPRERTLRYRTYSTSVSGSNVLQSNYATAIGVSISAEGWWLKDPTNPALNAQVEVLPPFRVEPQDEKENNYPLGASNAIAVSDVPHGIATAARFRALNKTAYSKLYDLLRSGDILLLEDFLGRSWFVSVGRTTFELRMTTRQSTATARHQHFVDAEFTQVDQPAIAPVTTYYTGGQASPPGGEPPLPGLVWNATDASGTWNAAAWQ